MCEENCGNCCSNHEEKDERYFIQFDAEQEDFMVESVEEKEDGSVNIIFTVSETMKNILIQKGLNAILKECIENEEKERGL